MRTKINYSAILTFFTVAIALRYLTNKTSLLDSVSNGFLTVILQGIGPAAGALLVFLLFKITPALTLKGNYTKLFFPFLLYWVLPIVLLSGIGYFTSGTFEVTGVAAILIYGLLEEIGWRGFLRQELKSLPAILNILIVAILWFAWHLNFNADSSNLLFFGILVFGSWGIGVVADKTYSLLAVSAFHSLNNFFSEMNTPKLLVLLLLLLTWIVSLVIRKRKSKKLSPLHIERRQHKEF